MNAILGDLELRQHIQRQIDASALGVLFDIAKNVGELEGDAGLFRKFFRARILIAEDANADETYDRGWRPSASSGCG
jgi:hypothetical protein